MILETPLALYVIFIPRELSPSCEPATMTFLIKLEKRKASYHKKPERPATGPTQFFSDHLTNPVTFYTPDGSRDTLPTITKFFNFIAPKILPELFCSVTFTALKKKKIV